MTNIKNSTYVMQDLTNEETIKSVCCFKVMKQDNMSCIDNINSFSKPLQKKAIVFHCLLSLTALIGNYYHEATYLARISAVKHEQRLLSWENKIYTDTEERLKTMDFFETFKHYYVSGEYSVFNESQFRSYIEKISSLVDANFSEYLIS